MRFVEFRKLYGSSSVWVNPAQVIWVGEDINDTTEIRLTSGIALAVEGRAITVAQALSQAMNGR